MERLSNFFEGFFQNIRNNPSLAGYCIAFVGLILLIAVILDTDWILEGGNGFFNIASISKLFSRTTARVLMGLLSVLIIISGLSISYFY